MSKQIATISQNRAVQGGYTDEEKRALRKVIFKRIDGSTRKVDLQQSGVSHSIQSDLNAAIYVLETKLDGKINHHVASLESQINQEIAALGSQLDLKIHKEVKYLANTQKEQETVEKVKSVEDLVKELEKKIESLTTNVEAATETGDSVKKLEKTVETHNAKLETAFETDRTVKELEKTIASLTTKLETASETSDSVKKLEKTIEGHNTKLEAASETYLTVKGLERTIASLTTKLEAASETDRTVRELERTVESLTIKLEVAGKTDDKVKELERTVEMLTAEIDRANEMALIIKELAEDLQALRSDKGDSEATKDDLTPEPNEQEQLEEEEQEQEAPTRLDGPVRVLFNTTLSFAEKDFHSKACKDVNEAVGRRVAYAAEVTRQGNIYIHFGSSASDRAASRPEQVAKWKSKLKYLTPCDGTSWTKGVISRVPKSMSMKAIRKEIERTFRPISLKCDPWPVENPKELPDRKSHAVAIAFRNEEEAERVIGRKVFIKGKSKSVRVFYPSAPRRSELEVRRIARIIKERGLEA